MKEIPVGISSTLLAIIEANPGDYDLYNIANQIMDQIIILEELRDKGQAKHAIILSVYAIVDSLMQTVASEENISCRKGCAFCCKMNVDVTLLEVKLIIDYCKHNNIPIDTNYLKHQAAIPKMELGLTPELSACAFLSKENTCKIYPVRPLACRKYVVKTLAEFCNMEKYPIAKIGSYIDIDTEILTSAIDSIQQGYIDSLPKILLQQIEEEQKSLVTIPTTA